MSFEMPKLQPVLMPVRNVQGYWGRTRAWMTQKRQWELLEDWLFTLPDGTEIIIPKGFHTDGASAPRLFWPLMPPVGPLLIPSLVHDFAYRYDYLWVRNSDGRCHKAHQGKGRAHWDQMFHELCIAMVGNMLFSTPSGLVMRLFGGIAWQRNRRKRARELYPACAVSTDNVAPTSN